MYIITMKEDNCIYDWDTELDYLSNGYPRLVNKDIAFIPDIINVCEYEGEIPDYVIPSKYCFTKPAGFYLNPNWVEPPASTEQRISELEDAVIELASLVG